MGTLVTGVTGFVGGHLAEHLVLQGDAVSGCARHGTWPPPLDHLAGRVRLVACDLSDPESIYPLFQRESYEAVFHLAGLANPRTCEDDPRLAWRENVDATRQLYEAIRQSGQQPRVLMVSTSYVYGIPRPEDLPVRTSCPIRLQNAYAGTKWAAEQLSQEFVDQYGLRIIRVRPFNHTGPRQPRGYVIPDWAHQVAAIERAQSPPVLRVGSLNTRRDYTDVRDVVRAYCLLLQQAEPGTVYNLGSGISHNGREILDVLASLCRVPLEIEPDPDRVRDHEAHEMVADATPLRQLTGWRPQIDLATTLRDTLDYWRSMP